MTTKKGDQYLKKSKLEKKAESKEKLWFEEIIENQDSDLIEEDSLAEKISTKTVAKYRENELED